MCIKISHDANIHFALNDQPSVILIFYLLFFFFSDKASGMRNACFSGKHLFFADCDMEANARVLYFIYSIYSFFFNTSIALALVKR